MVVEWLMSGSGNGRRMYIVSVTMVDVWLGAINGVGV